MQNWKTSLYAQIAYMAGMGLGLVFMPGLIASMLHLGTAEELWVRVVGLLALVLCLYYYGAIQQDARWFAQASTYGRYGFCAALALLGMLFHLPMLIVLALVEAGLAVWTHVALKQA